MRAFLLLGLAAAAIAAGAIFLAGGGVTPVTASHGTFNVHVHDDYFHPTGSFVPGAGHVTAEALCEQAVPDTTCTAVIHVAPGDSINWVSPAPLAANPHTVTECVSGNFTVCGPAVDPANPIGDSGVLVPPNPGPSGWPYNVTFPTPGFYYYRCEVHPTVMRGIVQVIANNAPPAAVGGIAGLVDGDDAPRAQAGDGSDSATLALVIAMGAAALLVSGGAMTYAWRRVRRED
jgi:plastocyanin